MWFDCGVRGPGPFINYSGRTCPDLLPLLLGSRPCAVGAAAAGHRTSAQMLNLYCRPFADAPPGDTSSADALTQLFEKQTKVRPRHALPRLSTRSGHTPPLVRRICSARATRSRLRPLSVRASWPTRSCSRSSCPSRTHRRLAARALAVLTKRPRLQSGAMRPRAACRARIGRRYFTAASRASCASAGCAPRAARLRLPPPPPLPLTAPLLPRPRPLRPARVRWLPGRPTPSRVRRLRRRPPLRACG